MARNTGSVCRMCRREGTKLFLKGEKCFSQKCALTKRPTPPGQHGQARQRKMSEYGTQLREKQKARRAYGMLETQFHLTYEKALAARTCCSYWSAGLTMWSTVPASPPPARRPGSWSITAIFW
jgi:small subunit ribosomal protein S4